MKKITIVTALVGLSLSQLAGAAENIVWYYMSNPSSATFEITLSGECSGKISLPVTEVYYGREIDYDGGVIDRDGMESYMQFTTSDPNIYAYGSNEAYIPGEKKFTESVKKGKRTFSFAATEDASVYLYSLGYGGYDSQISCKNGLELSDMLLGWNAYLNWDTKKTSATFSHSNDVDSPSVGEFKARFTASGKLEIPGECVLTGELFSADYKFVCGAPAKTINVKVTASAAGSSLED